jgi:hypothetical protein
MRKVAPPSMRTRWVRRLAAVVVALVAGRAAAPAVARAEVGVSAQASERSVSPLPRPGTERLIRIGPQALVREDDRGRLQMDDETRGPARLGRGMAAATEVLGLIGLGVAGGLWSAEQQDVVRGRVR